MTDHSKNKAQLIAELDEMRRRLSDLEQAQKEQIDAERILRECEERFKLIFRTIPDAFSLTRIDNGLIVDVNHGFCDITGYSREEVLGKSTSAINIWAHEQDREIFFERLKHDGQIKNMEFNFRMKNGHVLNALISARSIELNGTPHLLTIAKSIESLKQVEREFINLRIKAEENENKFRAISNQSSEGITVADTCGKYIYVNPAFCKMIGYTEHELLQMTVFDVKAKSQARTSFAKSKTSKEGLPIQVKLLRKNGTEFISEVVGKMIEFNGTKSVLGTIRDITKRVQTEESLRESEEKYRTIIDESPLGIFYYDIRGNIQECNKKFIEIIGSSREELIGLNMPALLKDQALVVAIILSLKEGQAYYEDLYSSVTANKKTYVRIIFKGIRNKYQKIIAGLGLVEDITERKNIEDASIESEERYQTLSRASFEAIFISEKGICLEQNYTAEKMFGYTLSEATGRPGTDWIAPENREMVMDKMLSGNEKPYEALALKKDGSTFPAEIQGKMMYFRGRTVRVTVLRDISLRKQAEKEKAKLEEHIRRGQKLETIGTLSGGIAHDFNNILTPILGYAEMTKIELPNSSPLIYNLDCILDAAHRAKYLVQQILLFSKQVKQKHEPLSLHVIVKEALKLLRSSIPTTIDIHRQIDTSCSKVKADATQMHQVVVNLCTNAWQAMEETGGTLTIELKQVQVDAMTAKLHPNLHQGEYVRLTVEDTGSGMDKATLERIFEPFFTTKAVDKGTGLGLSVVHGIVRNHHGDILVYSEPGKGTVFQIYLPVIQIHDELKIEKQEAIITGSESILIIDDDKTVGSMLEYMLGTFGYKVDLYSSSLKALDIFKKQPQAYDLVLSDLTMPDYTGLDLAGHIQKIRPGIPVILMTGYGDKLTGIDQELLGIRKVLQKPLLMNELATTIHKVLHGFK